MNQEKLFLLNNSKQPQPLLIQELHGQDVPPLEPFSTKQNVEVAGLLEQLNLLLIDSVLTPMLVYLLNCLKWI